MFFHIRPDVDAQISVVFGFWVIFSVFQERGVACGRVCVRVPLREREIEVGFVTRGYHECVTLPVRLQKLQLN